MVAFFVAWSVRRAGIFAILAGIGDFRVAALARSGRSRWRSGSRFVAKISCIPASAFQLKSGSSDLFFESRFTTRQAYCQLRVGNLLEYILGKTTHFTAIRVNRH